MKKKIVILIILLCFLGGGGAGGYWHFTQNKETNEITVKENQSLIVAQISEINGNEMQYKIAKEVDLQETGKNGFGERNEKNTKSEEESESRNMPEMPSDIGSGSMLEMSSDMGNGSMSEAPGDMGNGSMPEMPGDMENGSMSETPSDMENGGMPEMPGDMKEENAQNNKRYNGGSGNKNSEDDSLQKEKQKQNKTMYSLTGEEGSTLIPVGTTVTTQLGTTTTFSRLAAGDMVKLLMEKDKNGKDIVVGVWIVG